jgi:glycosyltransferase involved in cell wall biosynthesis
VACVRCLIAQQLCSSRTATASLHLPLLSTEPRHPFGYLQVATFLESRGLDVRFANQIAPDAGQTLSQWALTGSVLRAARSFDLVICYSTPGTLIASALSLLPFTRPRVVLYLQAKVNPGGAPWSRWLRRRLWRRAVKHADAIVSVLFEVTAEIRELCADRGHRVYYAPVGSDAKFFDPLQAVHRPNSADLRDLESGRFLLVVGDFSRDDAFLYEALADGAVPLVRVTRDPVVHGRVVELARRFGRPGDLLLMRTTFADLRWLYGNAAAVLFAGNDSWEPAGITSLTEALASGGICVAGAGGCIERELTHLGGESELLVPVLFYPPGDRNSFQEVVRRATAMSPAERASAASAGRRFLTRTCPVERAHRALWEAIQTALSPEVQGRHEVPKQAAP